MEYAALPEGDALLLARALGLLVHQAGIYGSAHTVTQGTARSVYAEMEQALRTFGPIEFAINGDEILINGSREGLGTAAGKNLLDRMVLHKIGGLLFTPPLEQREFMCCVQLFGTPPLKLAEQGGFEAVLKRANLRSVSVVRVAYQRVSGDEPAAEADKAKASFFSAEPAAPKAPAPPSRPGVLDLSAALGGCAPLSAAAEGRPAESAAASVRRERAQALATMLRDAAAALEEGLDEIGAAGQQEKVSGVLGRISRALSDITAGSKRDISQFARQVEEDSKTIASIESAARRRGIGLNLTRGEILKRYAELNQEIAQPLTVSTGVIDLLHSGKAGCLTESQMELLKLASESVDRVNQLVCFMNHISGLPEDYTPDADLIAATYR